MEPIRLVARSTPGGLQVEIDSAATLFERASKYLSAKAYGDAARLFDDLVRRYPRSRFIRPSLYNSALAYERRRRYKEAVARYRALIRRFPGDRDAVDAGFRLSACLAEVRNYAASAQALSALFARSDMTPAERVEAFARQGLAFFRLDDHRRARATLKRGISAYHQIAKAERFDSDYFVGMMYYYLAAIPHLAFRRARLTAGKGMGGQLDAKARLMLQAQTRYVETIKLKNPHWATAAGFQIGSLYRELYRGLMTALPDFQQLAKKNALGGKISADQARRELVQVYLEEVHKRVKPLLHRAIRVFERTVLMAQRVGIRGQWVAKSRHQLTVLQKLLTATPAEAIKLLPKKNPEDEQAAPPTAVEPTTIFRL